MPKHGKEKRKHYSDDSDDERIHKKKLSKSSKDEDDEINLINFSYLDHKSELTYVLNGSHSRDQLIENVNDFWIFVKKYESLLKKSGKPILPTLIENFNTTDDIPSEYNIYHTSMIKLGISFNDFCKRISNNSTITKYKLKHFIQIIIHYLNFMQKEKFNKLMKIRKNQESLPVAKMRDEIVKAVKDNQVVLIAGDTGCGKSTQVPQYLYHAGFKSIGNYFKLLNLIE